MHSTTFVLHLGLWFRIQKIADDTGETIEIRPEKVVVYKSQNDYFAKENEKEHVSDKIYELRNEPNSKIEQINHLLQNTVNPDMAHNKTVDIDGKIEKTIFYPKIMN